MANINTLEEMKDYIMERVENARSDYYNCINKPMRYREEYKYECICARLICFECMAIDLGLIETGTI